MQDAVPSSWNTHHQALEARTAGWRYEIFRMARRVPQYVSTHLDGLVAAPYWFQTKEMVMKRHKRAYVGNVLAIPCPSKCGDIPMNRITDCNNSGTPFRTHCPRLRGIQENSGRFYSNYATGE